jgi:hypothetical protein
MLHCRKVFESPNIQVQSLSRRQLAAPTTLEPLPIAGQRLNPRGAYVTHFSDAATTETILDRLGEILANHR